MGLIFVIKNNGFRPGGWWGWYFSTRNTSFLRKPYFGTLHLAQRTWGFSDDEISARVVEAMRLVGLSESYAEKSPFDLSGGEKRRAALAGIIAMRPKYLVLDEPMAGLDPGGRKEIMQTIMELREALGCAIVMVSHSMDDVAKYAERVAVLNVGRIFAVGSMEEIFSDPDALRGHRPRYAAGLAACAAPEG